MTIVWIVLIGFAVGLLARMFTPGRDPAGFIVTTIIGITGSFIATYGGQAMGLYQIGEQAGFIGSLFGAIALLAIYHFIRQSPA
jgi:uncharacterized membrane protein YeaQ/YmgE (transglycosylase-associated protein family)